MRLCTQTVTVFNARVDPATRAEVYAPTVLRGASWRGEVAAQAVEGGLKAANRFVLRIPADVDAGGKAYAGPAQYRAAADITGLWTLQKGDAIVKGEVSGALTPAQLRALYGAENVLTVLGVTDNRGAPNGKHWRVTGS